MNAIMSWLGNAVDDRLNRALACPLCGHGAESDPVIREEQAGGCGCMDDLCGCYMEFESGSKA